MSYQDLSARYPEYIPAIVLADKVASDRLTIHPGYREMPDPALELTYSSLIDNLNKIVKNAKKYF